MRKLFIAIICLTAANLFGQTLFTEDFESPVVSGYSQGSIPSGWVGSTVGFKANYIGISNIDGGLWTNSTPDTNKQAFRFDYGSNTGLTTEEGAIGALDPDGVTYTFSFQLFDYSGNNGVRVEFVAWSPDESIVNGRANARDTLVESYIMAEANLATTTNGQIVTLSYTTDEYVDEAIDGWDITIRFRSRSGDSVVDNVRVTKSSKGSAWVRVGTKLFRAGTGGVVSKPWTPRGMSGLQAWYDAAAIGTITENSLAPGQVQQWDDKSGNGNHLIQGSGSAQPDYIESDPLMNSYPVIYSENNQSRYLQGTNSVTMQRAYFVAYYGTGTELTANTHAAIFASTDNDPRLTLRSGGTDLWDDGDGKNFDLNGSTYRNGSTTNTAPPNPILALPMPASLWRTTSANTEIETWRFLQNNTATWGTWWGGLGEMIFTDGTEDLETQQKIEGYLAWKWGLQGELPVSHPYKNQKPYR